MRKYIVKAIILFAMFFAYRFVMAALVPEISIQVSLAQMEDTYSSMVAPLWYNFFKEYQWVFFIGFGGMLFYGEIKTNFKKIINFLKEKTDETN
jgi:hypothetical protein